MFSILIVVLLIAAILFVFAKDLVEAMVTALVRAPAWIRGLLGMQTMASLQRQAADEVSRRALVSIAARHLPNDILVLLHPEDYASVSALAKEFCEGVVTLLNAAVRNGGSDDGLPYKLLGEPNVRLKEDARIARGTVGVVASILEGTELLPSRDDPNSMLVLEFSGEQTSLAGEQVVGRSDHADIQVKDAGVSREHTRLVTRGTSVHVQDLGGPNGTAINGFSVEHGWAGPGDEISFGPRAIGVVRLSKVAQAISEFTTAPLPG